MSHPPRSAPGSHVPPLQRVEEPDAVGRAADLDDVFPGQLQQVRTYRSPSESRESLDPAQSLCAGWQLQAPRLGRLVELTPSPLLPPLPPPGARPRQAGLVQYQPVPCVTTPVTAGQGRGTWAERFFTPSAPPRSISRLVLRRGVPLVSPPQCHCPAGGERGEKRRPQLPGSHGLLCRRNQEGLIEGIRNGNGETAEEQEEGRSRDRPGAG